MIELAIEKLVKHVPTEMNILKVVEECAELQEVMVKYLTKNESLKPKMEKLSEEMGDVIFRIMVAAKMLGIEDEVQGRMDFKAKQLYTWVVGKYEN
jgi:NTP pyrophosphatase (non-canonical NTP hydrolase)